MSDLQGVLLINKPQGKTSFSLVAALRRILGVKKIGHAGTLDPMATGVMVMLIGSKFTRQSDSFLNDDKEYVAEATLGISTDSYDAEGEETARSEAIPTEDQLRNALAAFQGEILQVPPMFSAKKINGQKLYELARKGKEVERAPVKVKVQITLLAYAYPKLSLHVKCSKGTYVRSLAHDLGQALGCGAHLSALSRVRSGKFHLSECLDGALLSLSSVEAKPLLQAALRTIL
jgi:tRNA pseudouridine55 synthase